MEAIDSWIGRLIGGRYKLTDCIFSGSMSNVFKAWDCRHECCVVVKIAINNSTEPCLVERLKYEAMALERLHNPRIVRLLDFGQHIDNSYFIVLEYIHGMDLHDRLESYGRLSVGSSIGMMMQILEGLEVMHQKGLVHRDLKPRNIMVTSLGVKIIDLGLVRFNSVNDRQIKRLTSPGMTMGTPPYLSPEQGYGFNDLDGRSDLYVCGIILYHMMTGALPFYVFKEKGELVRCWDKFMRPFFAVLPPVSIPYEVQEIVWKALKFNPRDRYQTAVEMRMALLAVKPE